ncbi:hypothetical protein MRX96_044461 [Rhipicephalus microplus]
MGCEIFTTVGTNDKREFIKLRFPALKDKNIANSRDLSFEEHVMNETDGHGVNLVLNSLSDEKLQASLRLLGHAWSLRGDWQVRPVREQRIWACQYFCRT